MIVTPADSKAYDAILKTIGADDIEELDFADFFETVAQQPKRKSDAPSSEKKGESRSRTRSSRNGRRNSSKQYGDNERDNTPIVGLGDHVPAFLLREATP